FKNKRDFRARLASRAEWRAHYSGALRAAAGRALSSCFPSKDRQYGRDDSSADRASLLEFVRALCAKKPGALALDVQTLALPPRTRRSALPILCELPAAIRRYASAKRRVIRTGKV